MSSRKRALIYARVSTKNDQNPEVQLDALRAYCGHRDYQIVEEIVDQGFSGTTDNRPGLRKMIALTKSRKVDVVVTSKLDRLFRSLKHLIMTLQEFTEIGVEFISINDNLDFTTSVGKLTLHMIGAFAEFEASLIRERTIDGLRHAQAKGKKLGRPTKNFGGQILSLRDQGLSYKQIQNKLSCSSWLVRQALLSRAENPQK